MDQILLVLLVETFRYLSPFLFVVETCSRYHSPWQAFGNSEKFSLVFWHELLIYANDGQGLTFVMSCFVFLVVVCRVPSCSIPFFTENQLQVANKKLMDHGTWNE